MPEIDKEKPLIIEGFDQMQVKTSRFIKSRGNLDLVQNGQYQELGSIGKTLGFEQRNASDLTSTTSTSSSSSTTTSTSSSTTTTA